MRTIPRLLLVLMFCCVAAKSQVAVISGQSINQYGQPIANAKVRICSVTSTGDPCTPLANIFRDFGLTNPAPNPYTTDQYGNYTVYVGALPAPNLYIVQLNPNPGITWSYVNNGPFLSTSGGTVTGNVTVIGTVTATVVNTTSIFTVNGVQIACADLSDCANLAKINASNTFTGSVQTAPNFNATGQYRVGGVQIACSNLSDCGNLAKLNASNTFTGATQTVVGLTATTVNSTRYLVGGSGGTAGQVPCSDGSFIDTLCTVYSASNPPPVHYQTVKSDITLPQRDALEFSARFVLTDIVSPSETFVDINATGSDAMVVTAASAGTPGNCMQWTGSGGAGQVASPCYTPPATQRDYYWTIPSASACVVGVGQPQRCTGTTNLPADMPDANWQLFCTTNDIVSPVAGSTTCSLYNGGSLPSLSVTPFTYQIIQIEQNTPGGAQPSLYFHAHHN